MKNRISLLEHNTFGISAKAEWYAEYDSVEMLCRELDAYNAVTGHQSAEPGIPPILHIGGGSNLLFLRDYNGLVLHSAIRGIQVIEDSDDTVLIRVGAGMVWDELVEESLNRGWYGLENLSLIPGEVGAAAVQNIGAYGVEVKDFIQRVWLFDLHTHEICSREVWNMDYAYRYSALKSNDLRGRYAVTHVEFRLSHTFSPHIEYGGLRASLDRAGIEHPVAMQLRQVIIEMRQGKLPDPKILGNAGSFFMNPIVDRKVFLELSTRFPDMPHYEVDAGRVKIPAGWLIERAGWKGRSLGKAGVYERQALVLVNLGGAVGQDIVNLCDTVRADVKRQFGIDIHPEVNFIG